VSKTYFLTRVISPPYASGGADKFHPGFIFKSLSLNERDFYEFYGTYGFKSANKSISDSKLRNILK
jgi:hypothetical protein